MAAPTLLPQAVSPASPTDNLNQAIEAAIQHSLEPALRRWQASAPRVVAGEPGAVHAAQRALDECRLALAVFSKVLKRKPTRRLRRQLRSANEVFDRVGRREKMVADVRAYQSAQPAAAAAELQPLAEAWEAACHRAMAAVQVWQQGPAAAELSGELETFVAAVPVRHKWKGPLRPAVRPLLQAAVANVARREAEVSATSSASYGQLQKSLARFRAALECLGVCAQAGSLPAPGAGGLISDLEPLNQRLDELVVVMEVAEKVAGFLDAWAEHQAQRKAPQLYGAQAVLAYRQARRALAVRLRRGLAQDWRPVRASRLRTRVDQRLRELKLPN